MTALVVALTLVVAVLTVLVVGLLRSHADILRQLHELGAGDTASSSSRPVAGGEAPAGGGPRTVARDEFNTFPGVAPPPERDELPVGLDLSGVGLDDDALTVRVTGVTHRTLIAFLSGTCLTCQRFWDSFQRPRALGLASDIRLVICTKDPAEESLSRIADLAPRKVPLVMASEAWAAYDVPGSPYFVLVAGDGRVQGEGTGIDWPQVRGLLTQVGDDEDHAAGLESRRVRKPNGDEVRERRVDQELLSAGVVPGDASLFESPLGDQHENDRNPNDRAPDAGVADER